MAAAIGLITLGIIFVYSALKGIGVTEVFAGVTGNKLNPAGGRGGNIPDPQGNSDPSDDGYSASGDWPFKGPNANWLSSMASIAEKEYNLKVNRGGICRPANANYGSPTSFHKQCRAMDITGSVADRVAFARYAARNPPAGAEVFCDQAGMVSPGYEHASHVHVGA